MIINVETRKTLNVFINCSLLLCLLRFIMSKMSRPSLLVSRIPLFTAPPILNSSPRYRGPPKHKRQSTLNNSSKSRIKIEGKRTNSSSSTPKHSRNRKEDKRRHQKNLEGRKRNRTLFYYKQRSIFSGRRVFGVWIWTIQLECGFSNCYLTNFI